MRLPLLIILLWFKLANAQQVDSVSLYDSNGGFVQYLVGNSAQVNSSLHNALSKAYSDSLTLFMNKATQTNYNTLGYDTSHIKFTFNIAQLIGFGLAPKDTVQKIFAYVVVNNKAKPFQILFEDVSYINPLNQLIERVMPVPFTDLILHFYFTYVERLKEIYVHTLYLRDWNGHIIRLQNINLLKKLV